MCCKDPSIFFTYRSVWVIEWSVCLDSSSFNGCFYGLIPLTTFKLHLQDNWTQVWQTPIVEIFLRCFICSHAFDSLEEGLHWVTRCETNFRQGVFLRIVLILCYEFPFFCCVLEEVDEAGCLGVVWINRVHFFRFFFSFHRKEAAKEAHCKACHSRTININLANVMFKLWISTAYTNLILIVTSNINL